jgi:enoyl-[acyl-carrier protein] reductase III
MADQRQKNAVVTGGTRGIGRAISLALAASGASVFALYARDRDKAQLLEQEARERGVSITTIRGDLSRDATFNASVARVTEQCGEIDILVHSAASGVFRRPMDLTEKHLRWSLEINVVAVHHLTRVLVGRIPRGGRIIALTSQGGTRAIPFYAAIGASKGALESLMRHYAVELAPQGITVNLVCPGLVMTDAISHFPNTAHLAGVTRDETPTGLLTEPDQVASAVVYLCGESAAQITGQTLIIDGGKGLLA